MVVPINKDAEIRYVNEQVTFGKKVKEMCCTVSLNSSTIWIILTLKYSKRRWCPSIETSMKSVAYLLPEHFVHSCIYLILCLRQDYKIMPPTSSGSCTTWSLKLHSVWNYINMPFFVMPWHVWDSTYILYILSLCPSSFSLRWVPHMRCPCYGSGFTLC